MIATASTIFTAHDALAADQPGTLYFLNGNDVVSMPASSAAATTTISLGLGTSEHAVPTGIAVSGSALYFTTNESSPKTSVGSVKSVPVGGGTPSTIVAGMSAMAVPRGLVVSGDTLFTALDSEVVSLPTVGGLVSDFWQGPGFQVRALAVSDETVYVAATSESEGSIYSIPLSGGDPTWLANTNFMVTGIAVADDAIYLATNRYGPGNGMKIMVMPTSGGPMTIVTEVDEFPTSIAVDADRL